MRRSSGPLCAYCFDLLELDERDLRDRPLDQRKALLRGVLGEAVHPLLRYSDVFENPLLLLAAAENMGLEGIVSKRLDGPYLSGPRCGWVKGQDAHLARSQPGAVPPIREDWRLE